MGHPPTLAPPFTPETAKEKGRIGGIKSGEAKRAKKLALEQMKARPAVEPLVHKIVAKMNKLGVLSDDFGVLVSRLDSLWDKAFPKMGTSKPSRRDRPPIAQPIEETPQEPPAGPA